LGPWGFEVRIEAERLVKQADRDLLNAGKNIEVEAYEVAAFLAEQAVEKFLRAAWIVSKAELPPHTHYLLELGEGLELPQPLLRHLAFLNPDYTMSRYPDAANGIPFQLYDREAALSKVRAAREVMEWLRSRISA
jgi:HEPN domain-containing protein